MQNPANAVYHGGAIPILETSRRFGNSIMTTVTIEEAQAKLPEIIQQLLPGEEITITDHCEPLAQVKKAERTSWPCQAGSAKDQILWIAPDFDAPLDDFKEYME
jgi:antitoxin (DNA-binding transcriptional repressor) of toxin-antitoxin stability system